MIASLLKALQNINPNKQPSPCFASDHSANLTRGDFIRIVAAGTLAGGVSGTSSSAHAALSSGVSPVTDIEKLYDTWQERLNTGDLDGLVDLYMEDVTYINPSGVLMYGREKVREDFVGLLSINPNIVLGNRKHYVYQDVALTTNHWRMNFVNADGIKQELTGGGIEVLRKDPRDGGWRYIIDDASRSAS